MKGKIIIFCLLFSGIINGQVIEDSKIRIWSGVENGDVAGVESELFTFRPDSSKNNGSAVIICPGGSYCYLGIKHEGIEVAQWLCSLGFTAFVLKYRVGIQGYHFPAMIQDLQRSIQIIRENAKSWRINSNSVGVMGFSAGGHLVGTSAVYYNENFMKPLGVDCKVSLRPDFVVMLYPVVSMHDSITNHKSKRNLLGLSYSKELENKMSLEDNIHTEMPPIFLMQAKKDNVVDYRNSYNFYQKLPNKKTSYYLLYNCEGHGFGINQKRNKEASQWIYECQKWFTAIGITINQNIGS